MRQILIGLLIGLTILAACARVVTTAPELATQTIPVTPSPFFTSTNTSFPTATPTASITPLPTIPTFTPTFDASTIVTVTSAPKAECPKEDPSLKPDFQIEYYSNNADHKIPEFLHRGGAISTIVNEISKVYNESSYRFTDVTNDEIPELIFDGFTKLYDTFFILRCLNGRYTVFSGQDAMGVSEGFIIYEIVDMNKNGIPEIVIYSRGCTGNGCYQFFVGEWDGKTFVNLAPKAYLNGVNESEIEIQDINSDGILELILIGGAYDFDTPWRQSFHTYIWDGNNFVEQAIEFLQPEYRFQAIQDADAAALIGKHERASHLYQEAISNLRLEWWSPARQKYEQGKIDSTWLNEPTPSVIPTEDKTEYTRLAAYAYYRLMLLHLIQENEAEVETTYKTLQEKFSTDPYGQPYVEMANSFWDAYQSAYKMYDGCAAAIKYAVEHPEILVPLGSDYHGLQSHTYVPADVCPFR